MHLAGWIRSFVVIPGILACSEAFAQQNVDSQFKEVPSAANAFSLADPVPTCVEPASLPEIIQSQPIVIRLLDTQFRVDQIPVVYVRRAMQINDAASLACGRRTHFHFVCTGI